MIIITPTIIGESIVESALIRDAPRVMDNIRLRAT